ncbi:MAG: hypothetical protein OEM26_01055 [Saprospiraceae bacterium]|nr:hypothetical protein [Saprospiraceae bacterium]
MDRNLNEIRRQARNYRVEPNRRVWRRLESRLDQDKGKISISTLAGALAMAATFIIVTTWMLTISSTEQLDMQDLKVDNLSTASVYEQVGNVHAAYASQNWKNIEEGREKVTLISSKSGATTLKIQPPADSVN